MSDMQLLINELKQTNMLLRELVEKEDNTLVPLTIAAKALGISADKLREFADKGMIRAVLANNNAIKKHYRVNIASIRHDLVANGYLAIEANKVFRIGKGRRLNTNPFPGLNHKKG